MSLVFERLTLNRGPLSSLQTDRSPHMPLKDQFLHQAKHEYSPRQRIAALAIESLVFLVVLPYGLASLSVALDAGLH